MKEGRPFEEHSYARTWPAYIQTVNWKLHILFFFFCFGVCCVCVPVAVFRSTSCHFIFDFMSVYIGYTWLCAHREIYVETLTIASVRLAAIEGSASSGCVSCMSISMFFTSGAVCMLSEYSGLFANSIFIIAKIRNFRCRCPQRSPGCIHWIDWDICDYVVSHEVCRSRSKCRWRFFDDDVGAADYDQLPALPSTFDGSATGLFDLLLPRESLVMIR